MAQDDRTRATPWALPSEAERGVADTQLQGG